MDNQINNADQLIFLSKNITKNQKRKNKIIFFSLLMLVYVLFELVINGKCFLSKTKWIYLFIDGIMYFGVFAICLQEIIILMKKMNKKYRQQTRLRISICNPYIYLIFVLFITGLSLIHILIQVYFFSFQFNQDCFYYKGRFDDYSTFVQVKVLIFSTFILIEIVMIFFLKWVSQQNQKAIKNPHKFRVTNELFESIKDDIVLKTQILSNNQH